MRARPLKPGDTYEIETKDGFSYFQYTQKNRLMGPLIWLLEGKFREPKELPEVQSLPHLFCTFFPVQGVHKAGLIRWLGTAPIPDNRQAFPTFRTEGRPDDTWFWDGEKSWPVGKISGKQLKLPVREIHNFPSLVRLIETNWRPELGKEVWEM